MKIDLRTMTPTERELAEAALEKLEEAAARDVTEATPFYYQAGSLAIALAILMARKPETKPRKPT